MPIHVARDPKGLSLSEHDVALESHVAREPSRRQRTFDGLFLAMCRVSAWLSMLVVAAIVIAIGVAALPAMREYGFAFLIGKTWDANRGTFGILPEIWGTLYTSVLALALASVLGLSVAIFLSQGFLGGVVQLVLGSFKLAHRPFWTKLPDRADEVLRQLIDLLAAIPSVVYGLWGIFVVIPSIRPFCQWLHERFGFMALFDEPFQGPGVLPAVLVLAIMILPTITALSREALSAVPTKLQMASYGMGATRWETILSVLIPSAQRGILAAIMLAFGRALGETMALAMLVGNANRIDVSLFSPANTLAALLANNFPEASPKQVPVLMYAAVTLLSLTLLVNVFGARLMSRARFKEKT
ncbi:MAG: phosphate ABC transporter permease subunit PstC [Myxococcales bacterium]